MKKKNNKKRLLVALLLFAITGAVGFGVYSYYYTSGEIITEDETISITSFNPTLYYDSEDHFLDGTHYTGYDVTCELNNYNSSTDVATYYCTSSFSVGNHGSNAIDVSTSNLTVNINNSLSNSITVRDEEAVSTNNTGVEPGSSANYDLSAYIDVSDVTVDPSTISQDAQYASEPVSGADFTVKFEIDVTATEVH